MGSIPTGPTSMAKPTKKHIIEVTNLRKRYKKATSDAVKGVSFYVEEGAFFSLLGPNGAGKTTVISILTTILSPTSGTSVIAGFDVDKKPSQVRQQIGVIFQNPSLDLNLTGEENIRFHANLYNLYPYMPTFGLMPRAYQKKVEELAKVLGLDKDIHRPVKTLSGGMKRKLEIIRSLMHNPKVLFLDEPTTGLDPVSRQNLWTYLQEIRRKQKITIFLTTHYLEEAEGSDYICIIDDGVIVARGTPKEIKESLIQNFVSVDAKDRASLRKDLQNHKFSFTGTGPFQVSLEKNSAQDIISSISTKLSLLDIHTPTLDDAYVEIIKRGHANA